MGVQQGNGPASRADDNPVAWAASAATLAARACSSASLTASIPSSGTRNLSLVGPLAAPFRVADRRGPGLAREMSALRPKTVSDFPDAVTGRQGGTG